MLGALADFERNLTRTRTWVDLWAVRVGGS
ncbi:protein of unknown function [Burkholderia multivorans]